MLSRFFPIRNRIARELFYEETAAFLNRTVFPRWLPVLLGLLFGLASALLIAQGELVLLIPLAFLVPAAVLFLRYPFVAVLIWVLVFPYFIHDPSAGGRLMYWLLHRMMIPAALGIVLLSDWLRIRNREPVRFGRAELVMLVVLGLGLLNIVLVAPDSNRQIIRFYDRVFIPFCMYWLVRLIVPTALDLKRLAWVGFITVIAQCIIGITSWFAPSLLPEHWLSREGERTVGTFGNPAVFTSTLIFLSLLLFQYGMQSGSRRLRFLSLATLSLTYFAVFLSFSRGSWLGATLVWLGLAFIYRKVMLRWSILMLTIMFFLGATLLYNEFAWAQQRLNDQDTAQGRVLGAVTSIRMIREKPWSGWGFGAYDRYDEQFKTRVGNLPIREEQTSHNTYLLFIAEMGLITLLLYLFPMFWWLLLSRKVWDRMPQIGMRSRHLLAMLWLLLLDHFVVSNFMDMIQANLFGTTIWWLALGLIAGLIYPHLKPSDIGAAQWARRVERRLA